MKGNFQRQRPKKGIDQDEARRKREDQQIEIRKTKKEENLTKRRSMRTDDSAPAKDEATLQKLQEIPRLVEQVMSGNPDLQLEACKEFRKLLSIERDPPIDDVIRTGVVPTFVEFLKAEQYPLLQFEAAWALTNIASGTSEHTKVVIDMNAVPIFVQLLQSPSDDVREQAVWALGNIAGDSHKCRNLVLDAGAMKFLLKQLNDSSKMSMLRNATWTLSNFCRGKPPPEFQTVAPCLPVLSHLIYSTDEEVLTDACWALSYLSDGPNNKIQAVIEAGVCRRLVELLVHASPAVQTPALRTVGNIVTGDDVQTQVIINCSALPALLALLTSQKKPIRKEACWTISNITAGNKEQIQHVMEANIIPPLIQLLMHAEFEIKKEAAWAISNATSGGSPDQIKYLVNQGCIKPLCDLLVCNDNRIIAVALEGLENILKVGAAEAKKNGALNLYATFIDDAEGLEKIENLQKHNMDEIYKKAMTILETYFHEADTEAEGLGPSAGAEGFQFGDGLQFGQGQQFNFGNPGAEQQQQPQQQFGQQQFQF